MSFSEIAELEYGYEEFLKILDFNLERNPGISIIDFHRSLIGDVVIEVKEVDYPAKLKPSKTYELKKEKKLFDEIDNKKKKTFDPNALKESEELKESNIDKLIQEKSLTYCFDEFNGENLKCRHCFEKTIVKDIERCPKCNTLIKWF